MKSYFEKFCDETYIDKLGNCTGKFKGTNSKAPKVMIIGHMDSVGLIIRNIEDSGFIKVNRLGGISEKVLVGTNYLIRSEDATWHNATVGPKSHHVTPAEEKYVVENVNNIFLDVGATCKEDVLNKGIQIGCPVVYKPEATELMNDVICGTSVDNRGACASLVKMAEILHNQEHESDVYLVATVWEEFNLRGAVIPARQLKPDICISLDVAISGDTPNLKGDFDTALGKGPCVELFTFHGRGTLNGVIPHEGLYKLAKKTADDLNMNLQKIVSYGLLVDSSYVQLEGEGIATLDMCFATRYTHTPVETCNVKDIEQLSELCSKMVCSLDENFSLNRF